MVGVQGFLWCLWFFVLFLGVAVYVPLLHEMELHHLVCASSPCLVSMKYCAVLYCTVLYCTVLYCTVLCHWSSLTAFVTVALPLRVFLCVFAVVEAGQGALLRYLHWQQRLHTTIRASSILGRNASKRVMPPSVADAGSNRQSRRRY